MAQIRSKPFGVTKQGANVTEYIPVSYTHLLSWVRTARLASSGRVAGWASGSRMAAV